MGKRLASAAAFITGMQIDAAGPAPALTPTGKIGGGGLTNMPFGTPWGRDMRLLEPFNIPDWPFASREVAMSVPTIARCRDLICAAIGTLPIVFGRFRWREDPPGIVEELLPPYLWANRPDPSKTRAWLLAMTADDLIFHGRAYWRITQRYATGFPSAFERMPALEVAVTNDGTLKWGQREIPAEDVVEMLSLNDPFLVKGWRALQTALQLDQAAERFAAAEVPSGWLKQTGGEPMGSDELAEMATSFAAMRRANATAALNADVDYHEATAQPDKLQLLESRGHQALELSRLMDVPPYFVGAPTNASMTYNNAQEIKTALIDFGCLPHIAAIEQSLGGPNVVPQGQWVRLDLAAWLRSPFTTGTPAPNDLAIAYNTPPPQGVPQP